MTEKKGIFILITRLSVAFLIVNILTHDSKIANDREEDIKKEREVFPSVIILLTSESLSGFSARR